MEEAYSRIGRTYVQKAFLRSLEFFERKHRDIKTDFENAFFVVDRMCCENVSLESIGYT
jgi:hypothetical protein